MHYGCKILVSQKNKLQILVFVFVLFSKEEKYHALFGISYDVGSAARFGNFKTFGLLFKLYILFLPLCKLAVFKATFQNFS